jgi:predicted dehydrogenase
MNRVLIIGLGSIGQRHANALVSIGIKNIAALRTSKGKKEIDSNLNDKVQMFQEEEKAFLWNPTHIIISNPTSLHLPYIKKALDRNLKFFVEKPISDNLSDISLNKNIKEINGVVGYNLRFHSLIQFVKTIIENQKFGRVISAQLHVGQYLPNWHPYENYSTAYYSRKDLGGGALRTLSHEVDLMQFLFGSVKTVFAKVQKLSDLEIDVDDVTNILAETNLCKQVNVHINFLDPNIKRNGTIYFSEGVLEYDFIQSTVKFVYNNGKSEDIYNSIEDINKQYILQMIEFIEEKSSFGCSFNEGVSVMEIIEKCIQSNDEKKEICLI